MARCAFLTTDSLEDFFIYDDLVKPHLVKLGWSVDDVCWRDPNIDYKHYDLVVIRSTWDYQAFADEFLQVLERIESSGAVLENSLKLMKWNISKDYLQDLENKGVEILPTIWLDAFDSEIILGAFNHFNTAEIIIKPLVSANADFTYRLTEEDFLFKQQSIKTELNNRPIMIQSFEKSILLQGEFSLFYFDHEYSHTINKLPAKDDFRVQEEHGGQLISVEPTDAMLSLARRTLKSLPDLALYARIDMLETTKGLAIIEVELIEPSLYFNMDKKSSKRFAKAITKRTRRLF